MQLVRLVSGNFLPLKITKKETPPNVVFRETVKMPSNYISRQHLFQYYNNFEHV